MQRKRGELVPIRDAVSGLDDVLVPTIREASPQARHSFTLADQVNQLVSANETDHELGFIARMMALCSLPRSNPGDRQQGYEAGALHQFSFITPPCKTSRSSGCIF